MARWLFAGSGSDGQRRPFAAGRGFRPVTIAFGELLDASGRVHKLLFPGEERVAGGADADPDDEIQRLTSTKIAEYYREADKKDSRRTSVADAIGNVLSSYKSPSQNAAVPPLEGTVKSFPSNRARSSVADFQQPLKTEVPNRKKRPIWRPLILPSSSFRATWDLGMLLLICYVALVTPVEVGFMSEHSLPTAFGILNILVDVFFWIDLVPSIFFLLLVLFILAHDLFFSPRP